MLPRRAVPVLATLAGLALAALALRSAHPPYVWIAAIAAAVAATGFATTAGRARIAWFNLGGIALVLGLGELAAWRATPAGTLRTTTEPVYVTHDDLLGNAGAPGVTSRVTRRDGDSLVFDVTCTIDARGFRVTPPAGDSAAPAVAFFGDSFTFGEGVDDSATAAAQVGARSGGRFRGVNLGFPGWGPHQMLALLERRREAPALAAAPPVLGVYQAIPTHVYRVLGRTSWDPGPRYRLDANGAPHYAGPWRTARDRFLLEVVYRSFLVRKVVDAWNERLTDRDVDLFFAVVGAARRTFLARYPGARFAVIYWDTHSPTPGLLALDRRMLDGFARHGIEVVTASRVLPGWPADAPRYLLSAHDAHPNALADRTIAAWILAHELPTAHAAQPSGPAGRRRERP